MPTEKPSKINAPFGAVHYFEASAAERAT